MLSFKPYKPREVVRGYNPHNSPIGGGSGTNRAYCGGVVRGVFLRKVVLGLGLFRIVYLDEYMWPSAYIPTPIKGGARGSDT